MKAIFHLAERILAHPITNILLAIMFLYSGITEVLEDHRANETGVKVHHGVALYGLILFVKSFVAWLKALKGLKPKEAFKN